MLAALRFLVFGFVVLSAIYLCLSLYARAARREKLEDEWAEHRDGAREDFVARGMAAYQPGLRRRLVLGVYAAPLVLFVFLVFATNWM